MCGREGEGVQYGRGLEGWQVTLFSIKLIVSTRSGRSICVNRAFLALLHHHRPELVDIEDMQEGNAVENCTKAFSIAEVKILFTYIPLLI